MGNGRKKDDLRGRRFGKLTAAEPTDARKNFWNGITAERKKNNSSVCSWEQTELF